MLKNLILVFALFHPFQVIQAEIADLVLCNGKIVTVNENFRIVHAIAVIDGRIIAVGSNSAIKAYIGTNTKIIDLDGKMVLPGLIDSHTHPTGASRFEADHKVPAMESISDVLKYVRQRSSETPKGEWIKLSQIFITRLREQRFPTRDELDEAAPDHPVIFRTGPDASINSLAMALNGINRQFASNHPKNVMVDPKTGEPNGIIRRSSSVLKVKMTSKQKPISTSESDNLLVKLFDDYNRVGITATIDRNCSNSAREQYERLLKMERLNVRVAISRGFSPNGNLPEIVIHLEEIVSDPYFQNPDARLRVIGIKCFQDGGMLTGSAFFTKPWGISSIYGIDDPEYRGMQYIQIKRMEEIVRECARRNLAFTAHCQGDAAVETLIEVYDRVNKDFPIAKTRSTITHSSFMSEKAIADAARLGIGVDLQPAWLYLDARTLISQFGNERLKYFIPLKSLMDAGVKAGGGSDHMQKTGSFRSVNPYNPFLGMWIAATRKARWHSSPVHLEQSLSREQMIRFYTVNNAWLMRMEKEIGSLEAGKRADFIIIDRDLMTCPADDIRSTRVLSTWVDGIRLAINQQTD